MKINIDELTESELIDLNYRIVERLRFMAQARAHRDMLEFRVGDRVSFQPDAQRVLFGTLIKYNRKTVTVIADNGQRWNVSPTLLRKVEEDQQKSSGESNVFKLGDKKQL